MNHHAKDASGAMLAERLRKIYLDKDDSSSGECSPKKAFRHHDMIADMLAKACHYERDFLEDVLRLVGVYYSHGSNNTVRILQDFDGSLQLKQRLVDMVHVYGIVDVANHYQTNPTLSRIAEAFPHISLVMAGEINANPSMGLKLWVSDRDLGARVYYLFKLSCFPGMIYIDSSSKAQACLLLFNLCHAKAGTNMHTSSKNNIVAAFRYSCKFSTDMMEQRLAPLASRLKFTRFIEEIAPSAELMFRVWSNVIGEHKVPLEEVTAVTRLHEKVLQAQPIYLGGWKKLLGEKEKN